MIHMKRDRLIKIILVVIVIAELTFILVNYQNSSSGDSIEHKMTGQFSSCRRVYDLKEELFIDNRHEYDGDFAYLDFDFFAKRNYIPVMEEACKKMDGLACLELQDELYYYDIKNILKDLPDDAILSKEAISDLDYADYLRVCEDVVYQNTLVYDLVHSDREFNPIPSIYRSIDVDMLSHFNGESVNYHTDTYVFTTRQDEDIIDGYADVIIEITEIDEAYIIKLTYSYKSLYEDETYHQVYEKDKGHVAYAYVLR